MNDVLRDKKGELIAKIHNLIGEIESLRKENKRLRKEIANKGVHRERENTVPGDRRC